MSETAPTNVTRLLHDLRSPGADKPSLEDRLFQLIYSDLRRGAGDLMRAERGAHTLQPTALVHEAYLRLVGADVEWEGRTHFLGIAARVMRQVLVDHARRRGAARRGGGWERVTLDEDFVDGRDPVFEILDLDRALNRLTGMSERMARVAELRIFAAMSRSEIAEVLAVSVSTVRNDWAVARTWLARELAGEGSA